MARRPQVKAMPLSSVGRIIDKERRELRDAYAPLSALTVEIADPLAPGPDRFRARLRETGATHTLKFTENSLNQLCSIAGTPCQFLDRLPPALGLRVLRSLLEVSDITRERPFLFRMRGRIPHLLRAILPQSFVRLDDRQVLAEVTEAARDSSLRVVGCTVDEDTFFLRAVFEDRLDLGTRHAPDPAHAGIDIITSETGAHPLAVWQSLVRVVCINGMVFREKSRRTLRSGHTRIDREVLRGTLRSHLEESVRRGPRIAGLLAETRSNYIQDPREEIERVFRDYRLGSPRGRLGQWVAREVLKRVGVFGIERFEFIQAVTALARGCETRDRLRLEEAMGAYLLEKVKLN